jgi:DNA-binding NarL/FixJ family response regulator
MFREAIRRACTRDFGHTVVGETDSGLNAVEKVKELRPDLVILDLALPDIDGFNVAERLMREDPTCRILILSSHCDDYSLFRIERSGVHGFIDKNGNSLETLGEALKSIEKGNAYYSAAFQNARLNRRNDPNNFSKVLSEWERAILCLIGKGLSDDEIGEKLEISGRTVATHRSNIMRKLNLPNTPKLIAFAHEHGFTIVPAKRGTIPVYT